MDKSDIAVRMKKYEEKNRYYLKRKMPVIIRLDMRAGHSFTKGFERPFDEIFTKSMQETAKYLCENIQNCKLSYQQSDEITLLLVDYDDPRTDSFFKYRIDKLCSITASMATMAFNKVFHNNVGDYCTYTYEMEDDSHEDYEYTLSLAANKGAMFDARCFNLPQDEVTNNFYWRQLDAMRNSAQMVGQANFSYRELQHKSCKDIKDMLLQQKGINWDDLPTYQKRGSCCVRNKIVIESDGVMTTAQLRDTSKSENEWIIDTDIPVFLGKDREYIDRFVYVGQVNESAISL